MKTIGAVPVLVRGRLLLLGERSAVARQARELSRIDLAEPELGSRLMGAV